MTTHARIAAFLSTSALCLGLAAAPSVFAARTDTKSQMPHKYHKSVKQGAEKSDVAKTEKPGAVMAPAK